MIHKKSKDVGSKKAIFKGLVSVIAPAVIGAEKGGVAATHPKLKQGDFLISLHSPGEKLDVYAAKNHSFPHQISQIIWRRVSNKSCII